MKVSIRRQWNDYRIAEVEFSDLRQLHWDNVSGGVKSRSPKSFIHAFVSCDKIVGDISHSCVHGKPPHHIKVVLIKKDHTLEIWEKILEAVN